MLSCPIVFSRAKNLQPMQLECSFVSRVPRFDRDGNFSQRLDDRSGILLILMRWTAPFCWVISMQQRLQKELGALEANRESVCSMTICCLKSVKKFCVMSKTPGSSKLTHNPACSCREGLDGSQRRLMMKIPRPLAQKYSEPRRPGSGKYWPVQVEEFDLEGLFEFDGRVGDRRRSGWPPKSGQFVDFALCRIYRLGSILSISKRGPYRLSPCGVC